MDEISFTAKEQEKVLTPHHNALVISLTVANCLNGGRPLDSSPNGEISYTLGHKGDQTRSGIFSFLLSDHSEGKDQGLIAVTEKTSGSSNRGTESRGNGRGAINRRRSDPTSLDRLQANQRIEKKTDRLPQNPKDFQWTGECESALQELKSYLTTPPLLSKPLLGEVLLLYLAVSEHAVSTILVREEENKQLPIYYRSKALLDAEARYSHLEKLALALIVATCYLRPYFHAHPIVVVTSFPVKLVLHKPEVSGRLAKWALELGEYDEVRLRGEGMEVGEWILHTDGSSNSRGAGVRIVLTSPIGNTASRAVRCNYKATNNESEYEALIAGLTLAHLMGAENIQVFGDS
ncbi:PREDICTED: uncharacterized protein LOC106319846 [Brassica oleracea var. oleracea]|uniref:uncharacterized protein LOC106319846 n=1 Tax=Brassica oleracea var. oleracea TaxID=109376 RepID=UPI0006A72B0D|nr:PREDICTED: uncharacterized protein LOC106319846 [Brassica oleracea var. oleracea]